MTRRAPCQQLARTSITETALSISGRLMQGGNVPVIDSEKKRRLFVPGVCYLHTSLRVHAEGGGRGGGEDAVAGICRGR